jgi:quinol monooxygenase YgiN
LGVYAIAAYRPKKGKERLLREVLKDHVPILRKERLVTDRPPYLMRAADGTFIEVFEWKSAAAIQAAHENAAVQAMWARFEEACTYESLVTLSESKEMFANFESVEL